MKQAVEHIEILTAKEVEFLLQIEELASQNRGLSNENIHLKEELAQLKRLLFGSKRERFISEQPSLPQLDLFPEEVQSTDNQEDNQEEVPTETINYERKKTKKKPVREAFPASLRREVEVISIENLPDGSIKIGEDITEILEYKAAELYVKQFRRERYVVKKQEDAVMEDDTTVISAPLPSLPFPRCNYGASLVANLLISKFVDHLPFYRQAKMFKRLGLVLSESTINDALTRTCTLLEPLYDVLAHEITKQSYIQGDESPIAVLTQDKPGATHKGYFWAYHSPPLKLAIFDYQKGRGGEFPRAFLAHFSGILQTDGYSAYNQFAEYPNITLAACMAHARRKFKDALPNYPHIAEFALSQIQQLYFVERKIRDEQLSADAIMALRTEKSAPLFDELEEYLKKHKNEVLPQSSIGKAITYFFNQRDRLKTYLSHPIVEIDNNLIENSIRPIALGRKNYLFAGSHEAAQRAAILYSFFACCHLCNINPLEWLTDVLNRISDHKANKLKELLPNYWAPLQKS